jgi:membrane fusion protein (multidrug efflux system)
MRPSTTMWACAVLTCGLALGACHKSEQAPDTAASTIPVRVQPVHVVNRRATVPASGTVESRHAADIGFRVAGRVTRVLVDEGDRVKAGELLAALDAVEYSLGHEAAQADLARARDQYTRVKALAERNSVAPADLAKAEAAFHAAEAQAGLAAQHVTDAELRAPTSGVVGRRQVEPGVQVTPAKPAFTIVDMDPIQVKVGVPEAAIGQVREGETATVTVAALANQSFQGRVRAVGVIADPTTRTYPVQILLPNPKYVLRPGMIAETRIQDTAMVKALTVPGEAVVRDADGATLVYVYYPNERRAYSKRVTVGSVYDREVEVTSGLAGAERIVVGGAQQLRDGSAVQVVSDAETGVAPGTAERPAAGPDTTRGGVPR